MNVAGEAHTDGIAPRDLFPHIVLRHVDGRTVVYRDIWQHRNLVLVCLDPDDAEAVARWSASLASHDDVWRDLEAEVVLTTDPVPGVPSCAVLVADRWGEVVMVRAAVASAALPPVEDLVEWLGFVARACPECEGEWH